MHLTGIGVGSSGHVGQRRGSVRLVAELVLNPIPEWPFPCALVLASGLGRIARVNDEADEEADWVHDKGACRAL